MEKGEKRKRERKHQVMDKRMKRKVIKEKSDERWPEKRILKEISKKKKVQNKKLFHTQKDFKKHKRWEKEEKKKQKEKKNISLFFWEKPTSF